MRTAVKFLLVASLSVAAFAPLLGADWPHWRGPAGTGVSAEKGLLATWPAGGPKLLWKSKVAGDGFAGMAIVGGTVYTMGAVGNDEFAIAIDSTGKKLWSTKIGPVHDFKGNQWSRGPNATPTVDGELIYFMGSKGDLLCCKKVGGTKVWSKNLPKDFRGELVSTGGGDPKFGWGYSASPVVDGDQLVLTPGGAQGLFAALDKKTGKTLWRSKAATDLALYVTPTVATIGGVKQYITMTQPGLTAVSADKGEVLWTWRPDDPLPDVLCPSPIVKGDLVYATYSGDGGSGHAILEIKGAGKKFTSTVVSAEKKAIGNAQGGVVLIDKHVYGYHEARGCMCQDLVTGKVVWGRTGKQDVKVGSIVAADGKLYVLGEEGTVAMIEASPKKYNLLGTFELPVRAKVRKPSGKVWSHPSLSDGKLYLRDQELVFCYEIK